MSKIDDYNRLKAFYDGLKIDIERGNGIEFIGNSSTKSIDILISGNYEYDITRIAYILRAIECYKKDITDKTLQFIDEDCKEKYHSALEEIEEFTGTAGMNLKIEKLLNDIIKICDKSEEFRWDEELLNYSIRHFIRDWSEEHKNDNEV